MRWLVKFADLAAPVLDFQKLWGVIGVFAQAFLPQVWVFGQSVYGGEVLLVRISSTVQA